MKHFEQARSCERGSKYFDLSSMLMAFLAYEAYLNFLGDRLDPKAWSNEKEFFSSSNYRGNEGKLKRIAELCGGLKIDKGIRPYQSIAGLSSLRDSLVHAKVEKYKDAREHSEDQERWWPRSAYEMVIEPQAKIALEDVQEFIEYLHTSAKKHVTDNWFGDKGLGGITGYATSSSKPKT